MYREAYAPGDAISRPPPAAMLMTPPRRHATDIDAHDTLIPPLPDA